ncbi:hypothetical protein KQH81_14595 [Clostridium cadaveris]|uniref:hypothetical protein n=1 Tax=Clostridium cadaveris TaxID=1529 RepID=UPI001E2CA36D|nr:hypothetical protein [Clostridium cadaveris]UFH64489.1 hypothetical protein KQH81_14595 [Clostridium cadaveris]
MNKKKKFIINLVVLIFVCVYFFGIQVGFRFTPLGVHKAIEKKSYYGPSEIINIIEEDDEVIYVSKYDKWNSIDSAKRHKFGLWRGKNSLRISENKKDKPLTINPYYFGQAIDEKHTRYEWMIWGVINDENIKDVRLIIMDDGNLEVLEENHMKGGTYVFRWDSSRQSYDNSDLMIVGLDENENPVYKVSYKGQEYE